MIRLRKNLSILLTCVMLTQPALLKAAGADNNNAPVWYQFEVLVFERIAPGAGSTEGWPDDPGRPESGNATWFTKGQPLKGNEPIAFRALPSEERSLNGVWGEMRRSRDYRPLYHVAWRQPMEDPDRAKEIYFSLLPEDGTEASATNLPKLEGTLKLSIKRYLHLEADIVLHKPASGSDPQASSAYGFTPRFKHYRLQDSRRMRSGKLHYIDHPVIGLMAIAKRYEPTQPDIVETPVPVPKIAPTDKLKRDQPKAQ